IKDMVLMLWSPVKVAYDKLLSGEFLTGVLNDNGSMDMQATGIPSMMCDSPKLNLHDIEDMLLLLVQKKILNLERDVIYDLNVALQMFTRCIVILKRVRDLQLGVKSYQKKLNITKPKTFRNWLMRSDELYKFCDGTLTSVRKVLHDIASNLRMYYMPKRRWSKLDRKRSHIMIKAIDQQLFEIRFMRNLEKFIGGRDYEEDFRLLERTI
ncbi:hypothetical protein Tco_0030153, partial [Tanacetum coccineum]